MVIIVGFILLALGLSLSVAWWPDVLMVLRGLVPLTFLFWGGVALLVGLSERKARRDYHDATRPDAAAPAEDAG
jgi:hypothetical protein